MLSQMPVSVPILPLIDIAKEDGEDPEAKKIRNLILYEPNGVEVFEAIVPEYLGLRHAVPQWRRQREMQRR